MSMPSPHPTPPTVAGVASVPPQLPRPTAPPPATGSRVRALLADLAAPGADRADVVAAFWADVERSGTPLVEPLGDGEPGADGEDVIVTFLWRGGDDVAAVLLVANKIADPGTYDESRLHRLPGTDVWHLGYRMAPTWRASYTMAVVPTRADAPPTVEGEEAELLALRRERSLAAAAPEHHRALERWFAALAHVRPDPLARERLDDTWCVASLPAAPRSAWWPPPPVAEPGTTTDDLVAVGGTDPRPVWAHVPAGPPPPEGWPVLVVLDGERWQRAPLAPVVDGLAAAGHIPPMVTVGVAAGTFTDRVRDLSCNPAFVDGLADDVLGWVANRWPVTTDPARTLVAGQSLGGLTALFAAHQRPDRFGSVVAQSGSFWWPNPAGGDDAEWLTGVLAASSHRLAAVHLEVGRHEWVLLEPTRRLRRVLEERGDPLHYVEFDGGHDPACWRASLPEALRAVVQRWPGG